MADRTGFFEIIDQAGDIFYNTRAEDMVIYTETSNQNIMIGNVASNLPAITITSSNMIFGHRLGLNNINPTQQLDVVGNALVDGSVNTTKYVISRGLQVLNRSAIAYSNTSLPSGIVMGISNDSTGVVFSIASNAPTNSYRFLAASNEVMRLTGTGNLQVGGHILPYSNISFDLGSSNLRFRDLYLNSNTIFLGDAKIRRTPQGVAILDSNDAPTPSVASQVTLSNGGVATIATLNSNLTMSTAGTERLRITDTGNVGVLTSAPQEAVHVAGKVYSTTQVLSTSNDSAAAPSFSFREDSNTGMFHPSNDTLGFATAGTERVRITDTGLVMIGTSSNTAPAQATITATVPSTSNAISAVVSSGLLAWYRFDNNGLDSSSNAYHLTQTGSNLSFPRGQYGNAALFNNPTQGTGYGNTWYSSTTVGNTVATAPPLTVACWFNPSTLVATGGTAWQPTIFFLGSSNFTNTLEANINNSNLVVGIGTQTTTVRYPVGNTVAFLSSNTWYHLAVTYDGTTCSAFLNSSNIGSNTAISGNLVPGQLRIGDGGSTSGNASGWNGLIDDFRIYNKVLPQSEINTLYTFTKNALPAYNMDINSGLTGWYRLEGNGEDSSGCNWHATPTGSPFYIDGEVGQAAFFPNIPSSNQSHYLQSSGYTGQNYNPPLTISCWVNIHSYTNNLEASILNIGDAAASAGSNDFGYLISCYGAGVTSYPGFTYWIFTGGQFRAVGSNFLLPQTRTWYHLALSYDGTITNCYLNGARVSRSTLASGNPAFASSLRIGGRINTAQVLGFNGAIDDVRIYRRVLSDGEVSHLYNIGNNGVGNGTSIVTTGHIGIGTPAPQYPLDVVGSINASGNVLVQGSIGVGRSNPTACLDLSTRTDAVILPQGTTAQRPNPPTAGMFRFNTSIGAVEYYTGAAWAAPYFNGALFYNDGSTLAGWTVSGATVNTSVGNPAPSLQASTGQYAYILPPGVSTLLNTTIIFNMQLISAVCANLFFGANASGVGYMVRLDSRAGSPSGIATTTGWTGWNIPTGPNLSVPSGVWHSVKLQITGAGVVTFFLNGTQQQQTAALTLQGAYISIAGDGAGAYFDSISIYSGIL